jgi:hypothetical protein
MKADFLSSASRPELCGVLLPSGQSGARVPCQARVPVIPVHSSARALLTKRLLPLLLGGSMMALALQAWPALVRQREAPAHLLSLPKVSQGTPVVVFERIMDAEPILRQPVHQCVPEFFLATRALGTPALGALQTP